MTKFHRPGNPGPIQQSDNQISPSSAKPEDFAAQQWDTSESVTGQESDDPEAAKKSNAKFDIGSHYQRITKINEVGEKLP